MALRAVNKINASVILKFEENMRTSVEIGNY
jgi:hypothetical protein